MVNRLFKGRQAIPLHNGLDSGDYLLTNRNIG
jgi:hypothetical protein